MESQPSSTLGAPAVLSGGCSLTIRGELVGVGGDHAVHAHSLPDVRVLVHQGHGGLLPWTWPLEAVVVGTRGQVEIKGHVAQATGASVEIGTHL